MKMVKKIMAVLLFVVPVFVPARSKANDLGDFFRSLFGEERREPARDHRYEGWQHPAGPQGQPVPAAQSAPGTSSNSVPLDGNLLALLAAGLGLGVGMIYVRNKRGMVEEAVC